MKSIDKIELQHLKFSDYKTLQELMVKCYPKVQDPAWTKEQISRLTTLFPEGQTVIKVDGEMVACALSIIIDYQLFDDKHTYLDITANDTFKTHTNEGDTLYGLDMLVHNYLTINTPILI